ncbi:MAG: flagellar hook-basal body complex protein [Anaerovoracaceae bacterium]
MLGSMFSAVAGLSSHQTKMNVIGNNISNVNTYGFKASRVTFSDVFYQTLNPASAPSNTAGGTNPTQLGYGVKVNSIDVLNTRSGSASTGRGLDIYINGEGYLPVKDGDGIIHYTRVGVLSFDLSGNLVDSNGNRVLGFKIDEATKNPQLSGDGTANVQNLTEIRIDPKDMDKYTGIAIGRNGELTAIKEGDPIFTSAVNTSWMTAAPTVAKDSPYRGPVIMTVTQKHDGGLHPLKVSSNAKIEAGEDILLERTASGYSLTYHGDDSGIPITVEMGEHLINKDTVPNTLTFRVQDKSGGQEATIEVPIGTGGYELTNVGDLENCGTVDGTIYNITATTVDKSGGLVELTGSWTVGSTAETLTLGDITMQIDRNRLEEAFDRGMTNVNIGKAGEGPGEPFKIGHIASIKFANPDGLAQDGEGYFAETTNSGIAVAVVPGSGGSGDFRSGALEMSNVDLSREFTEMIITQRGFQANARMITVSDEMLSELVSMKR